MHVAPERLNAPGSDSPWWQFGELFFRVVTIFMLAMKYVCRRYNPQYERYHKELRQLVKAYQRHLNELGLEWIGNFAEDL